MSRHRLGSGGAALLLAIDHHRYNCRVAGPHPEVALSLVGGQRLPGPQHLAKDGLAIDFDLEPRPGAAAGSILTSATIGASGEPLVAVGVANEGPLSGTPPAAPVGANARSGADVGRGAVVGSGSGVGACVGTAATWVVLV